MISITCPQNQWPLDGFEKFLSHNEKIEAGLMLSDNPDAKIDRALIRSNVMTALLDCSLPAGNA